jgi:hypothetical protein
MKESKVLEQNVPKALLLVRGHWEKQRKATLMEWLSNRGDREENPDRDKS